MAPPVVRARFADSESVFKPDIFKGKVLFCTGGGSGICKGMTYAMMKHGANAAIAGRKLDRLTQAAEELSKGTGNTCIPTQADVRKPDQLKDAVRKTIEKFGRIDFVICGAAGNFLAPLSGLSENAFRTVMEIDTLGTFNTFKATIPYLRESHGSYIHVGVAFHRRGLPYQAHVSAAKAAIDSLSRVIAVEEGPWGVRSNVIAPGPISNTEGMSRLRVSGDEGAFESFIPLGREGVIQDIANATVFLFSDAASLITGEALVVDGGLQQLSTSSVPYPEAVLDPESARKLFKGKL
ncbi:hypothetical protein BJ322DRAFT_1067173 [Thelephora terrestris]|uniref:2,4-dienoyl-CoA reductase [(3E)-enoyl-CoA-producing] n=1 Tax=Thelephora terrestris TaxID=56493 RepID=A0A9P6HEV6_9AGAM|nr:hypothetical protein BJ322DRAFT_1067173 [Thelephora terrestris]